VDFKSSVEVVDEVTNKVSVVVSKARVAKEYESAVTKVAKTAQIDGFRQGKVPRKMVERLLGDRIKFDITNTLINEGLETAFSEHKLDVIGQPQVDLAEIQTDKELEFSATVELLPEPTIANYFDRSVEAVKSEVKDSDVEQTLQQFAESRAELSPVEGRDELAKGDVGALSVSVKLEDGEFSRPEPFVDEIGSGRLSLQVEEQLVGLKVHESKDIEFVADDSHPIEGAHGKQVAYKISLHGIYSKKMPIIDDAFAAALGMGVETLADLRKKLHEQLVEKSERDAKNESQAELLSLLVKENSFKVPATLVDEEIREMVARMGLGGKNVAPEAIEVEKYRPYFQDAATQRIRTAIIVDRIGVQEDVKVEEADTKAMIERVAAENEVTIEVATKALLDRSRIGGFLAEVRRTKILDLLMSRTNVKYVASKETAKAA
jgi:trigger factor